MILRTIHSTFTAVKLLMAVLICAVFSMPLFAAELNQTDNNSAEVEIDLPTESNPNAPEKAANFSDVEGFCFFAGKPPAEVKYTVIRKIKVGKGSYGPVTAILPKFARYAKKIGADAVIEYMGSQRFGFWPWRLVRPVVRGVAVKWTDGETQDCSAMGGTTLQKIILTDRPPEQ